MIRAPALQRPHHAQLDPIDAQRLFDHRIVFPNGRRGVVEDLVAEPFHDLLKRQQRHVLVERAPQHARRAPVQIGHAGIPDVYLDGFLRIVGRVALLPVRAGQQ